MFALKTTMSNGLASLLGRAKSEDGNAAVETLLIVPLLVGMYCTSFIWFDAFRHNTLSMKATYVAGDILSRDGTTNHNYIDNLRHMVDLLVPGEKNVQLRVTLVHFDQTEEGSGAVGSDYRKVWSYSPGNEMAELTQSDLDNDSSWIPIMSDDDALVITETRIGYKSLMNRFWGAKDRVWEHTMATRPRFHPTLINTDQPDAHDSIDDIDRQGQDDSGVDVASLSVSPDSSDD